MRVVFVAPEGVPFSKTGGLADVVGALPKALAKLGPKLDVVLPRYRMTKPGKPEPKMQSLTLPLDAGFKFASVQNAGAAGKVQTFFVECPSLFDRAGLYQEDGEDYPDNATRFAAFSLAALELIKRSATPPDIIHCHDWQTALVPIYLRNLYQDDDFFRNTSVVFTIHNVGYQGLFPARILPQISLHAGLFTMDFLEYYGKVNLLKGGIVFSDFFTTVSPKYAEEIQTTEFGCGLEGVYRSRRDRLRGILNGVDYSVWNPTTDKLIPARYSPEDMSGKIACKKALLERMGVRQPVAERPVLGIVSRFVPQKGFDLIAEIADQLAAWDLYLVALGTGDPVYEDLFRDMAAMYPDKFLVAVGFDNTLAHQIEAGSDMFLMPSRYEPGGLNQLYSLKYGTVPIVRATGGLDDTVEAFDGQSGTGFKFSEYTGSALLETIEQAIAAYHQPEVWRQLVYNGMRMDFSWGRSAEKYLEIYQALQTREDTPEFEAETSNG
ncbi:MAG TPA: glycogen synthase GlgA [Terriglobia bacterium]|nr:glycogen synthase GlgA [Terriglobia bacterium]